ncbi:hypothetical protein [Kitasatospora herbaricolor]|uniref:Uncharacterized protein n=1 Tax=Kitasatospora herbaricolor TaxID=68217 RepID=A0ABZ1W0K0_9ACTN|nr:hypothetical protein [Kitasatospora herbaricolor]
MQYGSLIAEFGRRERVLEGALRGRGAVRDGLQGGVGSRDGQRSGVGGEEVAPAAGGSSHDVRGVGVDGQGGDAGVEHLLGVAPPEVGPRAAGQLRHQGVVHRVGGEELTLAGPVRVGDGDDATLVGRFDDAPPPAGAVQEGSLRGGVEGQPALFTVVRVETVDGLPGGQAKILSGQQDKREVDGVALEPARKSPRVREQFGATDMPRELRVVVEEVGDVGQSWER